MINPCHTATRYCTLRFIHYHLLCRPSATGLSRDEQFDALVQYVARIMHEFPPGLTEARSEKKQQTQARVAVSQIREVERGFDIADAIEVVAHVADLLVSRRESVVGRGEGPIERVAPRPHDEGCKIKHPWPIQEEVVAGAIGECRLLVSIQARMAGYLCIGVLALGHQDLAKESDSVVYGFAGMCGWSPGLAHALLNGGTVSFCNDAAESFFGAGKDGAIDHVDMHSHKR